MNYKEKYTTDKEDSTKKLVSNDAFLNAEMLESLINQLRRLK